MDLLDSILNGMEAPPSVKKPVIKDKEKREKFEKQQRERQEAAKKQKAMMDKFRIDIAQKIKDFINKPITEATDTIKLVLKPMNKLYRSIVHETCEEHDDEVVVYSFGVEDIDRHCIIWKRGYEPCEDEIRAMKLGVEYKPPQSGDNDHSDSENELESNSRTEEGKDKFWAKYEKIIGENASGVESARVALPAKQYGCVPIENKKDLRSIEQMVDDLRKSKKQKTQDEDKTSDHDKDALPRDTL